MSFIAGALGSLSRTMSAGAPAGLRLAISAALGGTAEQLSGGSFANGAISGAFVVLFNHLAHEPSREAKLAASFLRNSLVLPTGTFPFVAPNPFYGANAIAIDAGITFVGAEGDVGYFFILAGEEAGAFVPYSELGGGGGTDLSIGGEIARIDYSGDPTEFKPKMLFGEREKVWIGGGEIWGASAGYAWSSADGNRITAVSISAGFSISPFAVSGGYNEGEVKRR